MQGLRKDHKDNIGGDITKGPKLRPLAAANRAPNAPLGDLMATLPKGVADELAQKVGTEVISTYELMGVFKETNESLKNTPPLPPP